MLLDRAASLATKINTFQKLKSTKEQSEQFATRATQFAHVSMLVSRLRETLAVLGRRSLVIGDSAPCQARH